ncbi:unnamed protein product [Cuscuta europaea]|uniref:DUF6821 domain-containing protein n=1 Tax=Cuscuta europaea TaxID=41803 RepID=A0A9P1A0W7_CUSEU|nr:unnamed protein product [Cuscuta europaea]
MDLDEWEVLSDDGFLQIHEEEEDDDEYGDGGGGEKFICRRLDGVPNSVLETDYFICPLPPANSSNQFVETTNRSIPPLPAQKTRCDDNRDMPEPLPTVEKGAEAERVLSQYVSLKKMKELVELPWDMDSPTVDGDSCFSPPPGLAVDGDVGDPESGGGGLNIWNWGFGAIFSFGVAAAAVCITLVGSRPNQKLRFQTYSDDDDDEKVDM